MRARALAAWSGAALMIDLGSGNPVYRLLVILAAVNVLLAVSRTRLRPLAGLVAAASSFAVLLNLLLGHAGAHVLAALPAWLPGIGGAVTLESLVFGLTAAAGLAGAVLAVAPLSTAAEPADIVDSLPRSLERTGAAVAAALNLVPGIGRSLTAVADAQRMRGWRPRGPRSWAEVLVPVMLTALEDSIQLAEAMEARGYGSGARTQLRPAAWTRADVAVLATAAAALAVFAGGRLAGLDSAWYPYPALSPPPVSPLLAGACLLLGLPALAWRSRPSSA